MRRPSITYEALLAALTLGAASSLVACSKGAAVRSEPAPAATASQTPTPAATTISPPPNAQPDPASPSPPPPPQGDGRKTESSTTVDAGREHNAPKPAVGAPTKNVRPNASAACGGSSCSPDMKKGN